MDVCRTVRPALTGWEPECPKGPLVLAFPDWRGKVESLMNIWQSFWHPLQVKWGMGMDTRRNDRSGKPILESALRHRQISPCGGDVVYRPLGLSAEARPGSHGGLFKHPMTYDLHGHLYANPEDDRKAMERVEAAFVPARSRQACDMQSKNGEKSVAAPGFVNRRSGGSIPSPGTRFERAGRPRTQAK